ncbi:MAG: hypothetical protein C0506_11215 [Anaerolinea sp.]|nr:hypothetical protein [Anaerolinea sp.]
MTNESSTVTSPAVSLGQAFTEYLDSLKPNDRHKHEGYVRKYVEHVGAEVPLSFLSGARVESYAEQQIRSSDPKAQERVESLKNWFQFLKKRGYVQVNYGIHIRVRRAVGRSSGTGQARVEDAPVEMTAEGLAGLKQELEAISAQRADLVQAVSLAREDKDFRENAPLEAAREALAFADQRQKQIETALKRAVVVQREGGDVSTVGSTVKVTRLDKAEEREFKLVGQREANAREQKISVESPVGKELLGRRVGDEVEVSVPSGTIHYRIEAIRHSS